MNSVSPMTAEAASALAQAFAHGMSAGAALATVLCFGLALLWSRRRGG